LDIKYAGYIEKERRAIAKTAKMEILKIPEDFDYTAIKGLSAEGREKLKKVGPLTLGQAARIPGVRQGDIAVLMVALRTG
jgi:tRNA uridine 5-carboxymethylaminomethyl modification enzyme